MRQLFTEMENIVTTLLPIREKENINPSAPLVAETKEPTLSISGEEPEEPTSTSITVPTECSESTIASSTDSKHKKRNRAPKRSEPEPEFQSKPKPKPKITRYLKNRRREMKAIMKKRPHFTKEIAEAVVDSVNRLDNFQSDNERDKLILTSDTDSGWDD